MSLAPYDGDRCTPTDFGTVCDAYALCINRRTVSLRIFCASACVTVNRPPGEVVKGCLSDDPRPGGGSLVVTATSWRSPLGTGALEGAR